MADIYYKTIMIGETLNPGDRVLIVTHGLFGVVESVDDQQRLCMVRIQDRLLGPFSFEALMVHANGESAS